MSIVHHRTSGEHRVAGNRLTLLQNGAAYFPQLCADIDAAQHSIYLETYIYAADDSGRMVSEALRRAAARRHGDRPRALDRAYAEPP